MPAGFDAFGEPLRYAVRGRGVRLFLIVALLPIFVPALLAVILLAALVGCPSICSKTIPEVLRFLADAGSPKKGTQ